MTADLESRPRAFFTIKELRARWSVSRATIYREIDRGRLKPTYIGGQVRFAARDIAAYENREAK